MEVEVEIDVAAVRPWSLILGLHPPISRVDCELLRPGDDGMRAK